MKYKDKAGSTLRSVPLMSFYWYALQSWRVRRNNQIRAAVIKPRSLGLHLSAVYLELLCCQTWVLKPDRIFFSFPSNVQFSPWLKRRLTIKSVFKYQTSYLHRQRAAKCFRRRWLPHLLILSLASAFIWRGRLKCCRLPDVSPLLRPSYERLHLNAANSTRSWPILQ